MKTSSRQLALAVITCALILAAWEAFGLGSDHPNDQPVAGSSSWPKGLNKLVNTTNRIHGFWVNSEDIFFFSGSATNLTTFLWDYSHIQGVKSRRLILHDGIGEAKSPWETTGRPCDWKLYGCPKGMHNLKTGNLKGTNVVEVLKAGREPGYVLEVHLWTGGRIALDQVIVPKNVEITKDK